MTSDRYSADVLASDWRAPARGRATPAEATPGLVVEEVMTDWCGEIVSVDRDLDVLTLEDRRGRRRTFPLGPGFLLEGRPVVLTAPVTRTAPAPPRRTASGSVAVTGGRARVARESRIFVEGRHDAELVEKVWGDDLRVEGVVVEHLGGVDDLAGHLRDFGPGPQRRVGVLVDHLVPGSKESRIADDVRRSPVGAHVLVVGPSLRRRLGRGEAGAARAERLAGGPAHRRVEARCLRGAGLAARRPGRPRPRLAPDPVAGRRPTPTASPRCSGASRS